MIKELFLLSGAISGIVTPIPGGPAIETKEPIVFSCEQNGPFGYDQEVINVLGQYSGYAMSLDFDTNVNDWYNPLQTNPYDSNTLYYFNFTFDLSNYVDEHGDLFPYFIISWDAGTHWGAAQISDDFYSFTLKSLTYSQLENVRIMYAIEYAQGEYCRLDNWLVTYWKPGDLVDDTEAYDYGYDEGYRQGWDGAGNLNYDRGYDAGKAAGFQEGVTQGLNDTGINLMIGSIIDYPVNLLRGLFNFEIFGVNLFGVLTFAVTLALIVWIIKRFKK